MHMETMVMMKQEHDDERWYTLEPDLEPGRL